MDVMQHFSILSRLTPEQRERILAVSECRKVKAGALLHDGGADCRGLILVCSGQLRSYILSDEGREVTICRFFERDVCLFSAACVMPNMQFSIFITAEKDSELFIIPACLYKNLMEESQPIASYSCDLITSHFSELLWLMEQIMWRKMDSRLAGFLLEETAIEGTPQLRITHETIANHLGTHREVVTRMLRYFQSEGMVRLTRGAVEITDEKKLALLQSES